MHTERGQEAHENYINDFSEKDFVQGELAILGPKIMRPHNSKPSLRVFFSLLHDEIDKQAHKNYIVSLKKILAHAKLAILGRGLVRPYNLKSTRRMFFQFCTMKGANPLRSLRGVGGGTTPSPPPLKNFFI